MNIDNPNNIQPICPYCSSECQRSEDEFQMSGTTQCIVCGMVFTYKMELQIVKCSAEKNCQLNGLRCEETKDSYNDTGRNIVLICKRCKKKRMICKDNYYERKS